jgi:hypothetical protein
MTHSVDDVLKEFGIATELFGWYTLLVAMLATDMYEALCKTFSENAIVGPKYLFA